jgi:hypothetical protein
LGSAKGRLFQIPVLALENIGFQISQGFQHGHIPPVRSGFAFSEFESLGSY